MFGLGFLAPAFLAGLLAVAIPIALHLARRRTDRVVEFPAAQMVPHAPVALRERRRLRDLLLLALRVAAIVMLAVSFARPYFTAGASRLTPATTILAVDTSFSLSAPGQWAAAQQAALTALADTPAGHVVGLVAFDDRATLVAAPTPDRATVRAAVAGLAPGSGGTRYTGALARAAEAIGPTGGRIVVVTDLQSAGLATEDATGVPDGIVVSVAAVPPPPANLAVTSLARSGRRITAVIQSYAPSSRAVTAHARVGSRDAGRVRLEVGPHASAEAAFDADWPSTGVVEVAIDDAEGYAGDNVRYLPLDGAPTSALLVVTSAPPESETTGLYVQRALEVGAASGVMPGAAVRVTDGRRFALDPARRPAAVFVVGTRTLDRAARAAVAAYLRAGGRVFLTLGPDVDVPSLSEVVGPGLRLAPDPVQAEARDAALVPADRRHPILRQLMGSASSIGGLAIERYYRVLDESGWTVLARFAGGALALAERPVGDGTLMVFASDLDNRWNRFPLEPGFAPFVIETARYLTRDEHGAAAFVLPDVPAGVPPVAGVQTLDAADGRTGRQVVVNVNPRESDPAAVAEDAFLAAVPRRAAVQATTASEEARAQEASQRLWQLGLLAMLVLLVAEGAVGRLARRETARAPEAGAVG